MILHFLCCRRYVGVNGERSQNEEDTVGEVRNIRIHKRISFGLRSLDPQQSIEIQSYRHKFSLLVK